MRSNASEGNEGERVTVSHRNRLDFYILPEGMCAHKPTPPTCESPAPVTPASRINSIRQRPTNRAMHLPLDEKYPFHPRISSTKNALHRIVISDVAFVPTNTRGVNAPYFVWFRNNASRFLGYRCKPSRYERPCAMPL